MPDGLSLPVLISLLVVVLILFELRGALPRGPRGPFSR